MLSFALIVALASSAAAAAMPVAQATAGSAEFIISACAIHGHTFNFEQFYLFPFVEPDTVNDVVGVPAFTPPPVYTLNGTHLFQPRRENTYSIHLLDERPHLKPDGFTAPGGYRRITLQRTPNSPTPGFRLSPTSRPLLKKLDFVPAPGGAGPDFGTFAFCEVDKVMGSHGAGGGAQFLYRTTGSSQAPRNCADAQLFAQFREPGGDFPLIDNCKEM